MSDTKDEAPSEFAVKLIRLADGTLIDPLTREAVNRGSSVSEKKSSKDEPDEELPEEADDFIDDMEVAIAPLARRSIHDISLDRNHMAVVCMALVYKHWGLPDDEIAMAIGTTPTGLAHVRDLDMYTRLDSDFIESLKQGYQASVEGLMQTSAYRAAKRMISMMDNKSHDIRMAAAKDVLDRSGHRPADRIEHSIRMEQDLVVRVIRERDEEGKIPTIDLEAL